ncbi:hypothetical protein IAT40_000195 [Kwoniella sp. CBS 6097]
MYEDLHHNALTIHSGLYFKAHHILRRMPPKEGGRHAFVMVDFQKSFSLEAVAEEDLPGKLGFEDWGLMDNLVYAFIRHDDLQLYNAEGNLLCGYQRPWGLGQDTL